eukprot:SAG25_NODE_5319_length_673_cov_1.414634_1_plen_33_part_01
MYAMVCFQARRARILERDARRATRLKEGGGGAS